MPIVKKKELRGNKRVSDELPEFTEICIQEFKVLLTKPLEIDWGKGKALRFSLFLQDKDSGKIVFRIPGFTIRDFALNLPQRKTNTGYVNSIELHSNTLRVIQNYAIALWKDYFPNIQFPLEEKGEE